VIDAPHDLNAERGLISCAFKDDATRQKIFEAGIASDAFYNQDNKLIWEGIAFFNDKGATVDEISVSDYLQKHAPNYTPPSSFLFVNEVSAVTDTGASYLSFLDVVNDHWIARTLQARLADAHNIAWDFTLSGKEKITELLPVVESLNKATMIQRGRPKESPVDEMARRIDAKINGTPPEHPVIEMGIEEFDEKLLPFTVDKEDYLVIFAARPSRGKSSAAKQLVTHNIRRGMTGVVFTIENSPSLFLEDVAASISGVNPDNLKDFAPVDIPKLKSATQRVRKYYNKALFVFEDNNISAIENRLRHLKTTTTIDFVIIDYLQLIKPDKGDKKPRHEQVESYCDRLRTIAKYDLECPIVLCSQLNRDADYMKSASGEIRDNPPLLSNLARSGAIEEHADAVVFFHRPPNKWNEMEKAFTGEGQILDLQERYDYRIIVAKRRRGIVGGVRCEFKGVTKTFY